MRQAVILCGGRGRRLAHITGDLPKGLVPLTGKPLLAHQLEELRCREIEEVIFCVGYGADTIRAIFGDGSTWGLRIVYSQELIPLGTAGAVRAIQHPLDRHFLVIYGDLLFCLDLAALAHHHYQRGGLATLVLHPSDHPYDSDLVVLAGDSTIVDLPGKPCPGDMFVNLTSAAVYALNRELLQTIPPHGPTDFASDIFPSILRAGKPLIGFVTPDYCRDIGQEERYWRAISDLCAGRVHAAGCPA